MTLEVILGWDSPTGDASSVTGYQYRQASTGRRADDDRWADISDSDTGTISHTVTGLTNDTTYVFWVRAVNKSGESLASDPAIATPLLAVPAIATPLLAVPAIATPLLAVLAEVAAEEVAARAVVTPPNKPTGFTATAGNTRVDLGWNDPSDSDIDYYQGAVNDIYKLVASDPAVDDEFGWSVAIDGDTVVVGARYDDDTASASGSVYVFTRDTFGVWSQAAKLSASDPAANDYFGYWVAVDGDTVVVGAYGDDYTVDSTTYTDAGSVYVFVKPSSGGWATTATETAKLTASDPDSANGDYFGYSVAVDGDTVVVGAYGDDYTVDSTTYTDAGSVYVFVKPSSGGWATTATETAKLTASDPAANDEFGYSVAIDSDTVVVGARYDDDGGSASGSVYVFVEPSNGWATTAAETAKLTASDSAANDQFGVSAAVDGDTVVVGAYWDDDGGSASGSVYVFVEPSNGWGDWDTSEDNETAKLTASDGAAGDELGLSVAVDDSTVVAGAQHNDDNGTSSGSAYVFVEPSADDGGWTDATETTKLSAPDTAAGDRFGVSVAADGDWLVIGANQDDDTASNSGSAHVVNNGSQWTTITGSGATTTAASVTGLTNGVEYQFRIRAVDNDNGPGPATDPVHATPFLLKPDKPSGFSATAGNTKVDLGWTAPNNTTNNSVITHYQMWLDKISKLVASDHAAEDYFGHAVAVDGDTIVIGARYDDDTADASGSVYVFTKDASGVWGQAAKLTASDAADSDYFGESVAVDGDTIVIGAHYDDYTVDSTTYTNAGSVYVFVKPSSGGWTTATETAKLVASDPADSDEFGYSVAVDGDTIVIGARHDDYTVDSTTYTDAGSVYVFVKPEGGWVYATETAKLTASDAADSDEFGYSVAVDGDTIVIGAYADDDGGTDSGSAYVFVEPSSGGWATTSAFTAKLTASDAANGDRFGGSVAVDSDTIVIGARWDDDGGSASGSAYVFVEPSSGGWATTSTFTAKLTASDAAANDWFGWSVGVDGDTIVIGAYRDDDGGSDSGSAYVFVEPAGGWATTSTFTTKLTASDAAANDEFGYSVAVDDDTIVIGAHRDDDGGSDSGSAYVVGVSRWSNITGSGPSTISLEWTGLVNDTDYAFRVRAVNASGPGPASDIAHATPFLLIPDQPANLITAAGDSQVTLQWDQPDQSTENNTVITKYQMWQRGIAKLVASDAANGDEFGYAVAMDGDTIVIGARYEDTYVNSGSAYVFTRDASGAWSQTAKLTASDTADNDHFGWSVAVNGDTIVIGAPGDDYTVDSTTYTDAGSAYVFTRDASGAWSQAAKLTASDAADNDEFGKSVAVNGDTIVIGAHYDDYTVDSTTYTNAGSVYVFVKPGGGWATTSTETAKLTASDRAAYDYFGVSVAVDGDTIVIGAHYDDSNSGSVYVFVEPSSGGWATTSTHTAKLTASDRAAYDEFGVSVAVDGDTIVIGAYRDDSNSGSVYVFVEPAGGWASTSAFTAKLRASDRAAYDEFGVSVAVDGDTIVAGARGDDNPSASGSVYVFVEPSSGGWVSTSAETVKLRAFDGADSDLFGWSVGVDGDTVVVGAYGDDDSRASSGSAYVGGVSSEWTDIMGSGPSTVLHTVTGLVNDTYYTFGVRAENASGFSPDSATANATPFIAKPAQPTGLNATAAHNRVTLEWDNPDNSTITGYDLLQTKIAKLLASDPAASDYFGRSVAVDGDTVVVGAHGDDDGGSEAGSVYVFTRDASGVWSQAAKLTASDGAANDWFGYSVGVDGDTVVVGARYDDSYRGSAYVFVKPAGGWATTSTFTAKLTASDGAAADYFGVSVGVDGDTIVIGAYGDDDGGSQAGCLCVCEARRWLGHHQHVYGQTHRLRRRGLRLFRVFGGGGRRHDRDRRLPRRRRRT